MTSNENRPKFFLMPDWEIDDLDIYVDKAWKRALALNITSRAWLDALTRLYFYEGLIFWQSGMPYKIPDVDDEFPQDHARWFRGFLETEKGHQLPRVHRREKKERIRLIEVYCSIREFEASIAPRLPFFFDQGP